MNADLLVVGGGWAGCSAALTASCRGLRTVLVEASPRLGGRASSFEDEASGAWLDHGQHLFLGAYRETLALLDELGTRAQVDFSRPLRVPFLMDDGRIRALQASSAPGPLGLGLGLLRFAERGEGRAFLASLLGLGLDPRKAWALSCAALGRLPRSSEKVSVAEWLAGQDPRLLARVWEPMVLAVLNARPEQARLREFLAALGQGFLRGGSASALGLARVPLARLLQPLPERLRLQGSEVHLGCVAQRLEVLPGGAWRLSLGAGRHLEAPCAILALPARRTATLLGPDLAARLDLDADAARPSASIVSVWLWSDEPLLPEPMLAFGPQGSLPPAFHWGFSSFQDGQWRTCVVTSAAVDQAGRPAPEIEASLAAFLASRGRPWRWTRSRVVRERSATPVFTPGSSPRRAQATDIPGLALAGDWTETGLPATIEGAVRSGRLAFESLSFDER